VHRFHEILRYTARDLACALSKNIQLPAIQEWSFMNSKKGMEKYHEQKKLVFILDGTSLNIHNPTSNFRNSHSWYVNYKKHSAWRYFVCVTANGKVVWVSKVFIGKENDGEIYKKSGLKEILEKEYPKEGWGEWKPVLGGDKGYVFITPPNGWELLLTQSAEKEMKGSEQTEVPQDGDPQEQNGYVRTFDTDFAVPRAVVERTINVIKRWKKLFNGTIYLRQGDSFLDDLVVIACSYANKVIGENLLLCEDTDGSDGKEEESEENEDHQDESEENQVVE
jgi:hypothetical protein